MSGSDKTYRNWNGRITELVEDDGILEGFVFEDCHLKGPAILVLQGSTAMASNNLGGPNPDAILWEIPDSRRIVVGAILAKDCTFEDCTFANVGFAGPPEFISRMRADLDGKTRA